MLISRSDKPEAVQARLRRRLRRHWDQPILPTSIGCASCPQYRLCGGLHTEIRQFDCLAYCCGNPSDCSKVCRRTPARFTQQIREIGGFDLENTPRASAVHVPSLPSFIPVLYHKGSRRESYNRNAVALSLYSLFDKRRGIGRFNSRESLCETYGLAYDTAIVLTGTDLDPPLERWWRYGEDRRRAAIAYLRRLGIVLATTPNFSLFANIPRWDDLHSIKRIAIIQSEFAQGGIAAALHVNGRTQRDFERWATFLRSRPEITHIAYEFGTGAGRAERIAQHVSWLVSVAQDVGRPLTLVVRGGVEILPKLASVYDRMIFLDTAVFMKTINRQRAVQTGNVGLDWQPAPTPTGMALDKLFEENLDRRESIVRLLLADPLKPMAA